jgi:hypothetical protein
MLSGYPPHVSLSIKFSKVKVLLYKGNKGSLNTKEIKSSFFPSILATD